MSLLLLLFVVVEYYQFPCRKVACLDEIYSRLRYTGTGFSAHDVIDMEGL